jgi:hypothetical protein
MRGCRIARLAAASAAAIALAAISAVAGEVGSGIDLWYGAPGLPPRTDTGKPAITLPPALFAPEPDTCLPALPCGTRLIGRNGSDGAVVLQVPALRW